MAKSNLNIILNTVEASANQSRRIFFLKPRAHKFDLEIELNLLAIINTFLALKKLDKLLK